MRIPAYAVLSFALLTASQAAAQLRFPVPLTQERAVSDPLFAAAAEAQGVPRIATNGEIALAVWADSRSGVITTYATRIGRDAIALESLGIPLAAGSAPEAVVWNGSEFMVVLSNPQQRETVFIAPDGGVAGRKALAVPITHFFAAALSPGANVRLLFVGPTELVVDGHGDIVEGNRSPVARPYVAAGTDSEFILVAQVNPIDPKQPRWFASYCFDANGSLLSIVDAKLPVNSIDGLEAIAGGKEGFLLVRQNWLDPAVIAYRLDRNGVFHGDPILISPADPADLNRYGTHVAVVREPDRYVVTWDSAPRNGHSFIFAAVVGWDGTAGQPRLIHDWVGITLGAAVISSNGLRVIVTGAHQLYTSSGADAFAQTLNASLEAGPLQLVASSATLQSNGKIAVADNGYAVMWTENGPDRFVHVDVRRFDATGTPLDEAPVEVMRTPQDFTDLQLPDGRIVCNGGTYLVAWPGDGGWQGRRMLARTGEWLDAGPFALGIGGEIALASNGTDVVALGAQSCAEQPGYFRGCVIARRITMAGDPLPSPIFTVAPRGVPYSFALASNGTDYLASWSDGDRQCVITCPPFPPFRLLAVRLRADGTAIDPEPLVIEQQKGYPDMPSIAWSGGRYLVAWSEGSEIRGTRITAEGAIEADGIAFYRADGYDFALPNVLALDDGFALLIRTRQYNQTATHPVWWEGVAFPADASLPGVAALPRSMLVSFQNDKYDSFSAAAQARRMAFAYNRTSDRSLGGVARVVLRLLAVPPARRRAATR